MKAGFQKKIADKESCKIAKSSPAKSRQAESVKTEKEMFETNENENIEKKNERKVSFLDLLSENANSNKSWRQNRRKKG